MLSFGDFAPRPVHFRSYAFSRLHCVFRGVEVNNELVVTAIRDALETEPQIDLLRHLQEQQMISDETFVENSRLFETAINCHYFIVDVEYSALIVHKMLVNLKTIDRKLYDAIQGNRHTHCRCCWCCDSVQPVFLWLQYVAAVHACRPSYSWLSSLVGVKATAASS